ncbi:MAG: hypothetical protein KJZ78_05365 [Bryobacteraceae bacterium]|nr:hypothetical protein [Bryobacteraceae bacterium]
MKWLVRFSLLFVTMAAVAAAGWYAVERLRPVPLAYSTPSAIPEVLLDHGQVKVATNCEFLYASVSTQRDELLAYLEFQYLRGLGLPGSSDVLLTVPRTTFSDRTYRVALVVENDLLRTSLGAESQGLYQLFRYPVRNAEKHRGQARPNRGVSRRVQLSGAQEARKLEPRETAPIR